MSSDNKTGNTYPNNLLETSWSQDKIYSRQLYNPQSLIGCVPVAYGQIMRYHKFPSQGKGVIEKHHSLPEEVDIDGFTYSYESMPDWLAYDAPEIEIYSIGILLAHIAYAFKTSVRNDGGSPTRSDDIAEPLVKNFSYDRNVKRVNISDARMSLLKFSDIIKSELNAKRPVSVGIPGHSIVCTGYNEDNDKFNFNYGWGTSIVSTKLDSIKPDVLFYCIKPGIREVLKLKGFVYNGRLNFLAGDTDVIELEVKNIDAGEYNGLSRLVLRDKFNYSQDILSKSSNLLISPDNYVILRIEFTIPDEPSFGDFYLNLEYEGLDGEFRYLTNEMDEFSLLHVNISREANSKVKLADFQNIPEKFVLNELHELTLSLKTFDSIDGVLLANIVDENGNIIQSVGSANVLFASPGDYLVDIDILASNIKSQDEYLLQFMFEDNTSENCILKSVEELSSGIRNYKFQLLNDYFKYNQDAFLTEDIDISEGFQSLGIYDLNVKYATTNENGTAVSPHYIRIEIIDKDRNVMMDGQSALITSLVTGDYEATVPLLTRGIDPITEDTPVFISVSYHNIIQGSQLLLTPANVDIYNPSNTIIQYRHPLQYIELKDNLKISSSSVAQGDDITVNTSIVMNIPNGEAAYVFDYKIFLENANNELLLLGGMRYGISNGAAEFNTTVTIPQDLQTGIYKIYPAFDFNEFYGFKYTDKDSILKASNPNICNCAVIEVEQKIN